MAQIPDQYVTLDIFALSTDIHKAVTKARES